MFTYHILGLAVVVAFRAAAVGILKRQVRHRLVEWWMFVHDNYVAAVAVVAVELAVAHMFQKVPRAVQLSTLMGH